jgi:multidrug resistance efflux pump
MRFLARNYVGLVLLGITLGLLFAASLLLVSALRDDDDGFRPRRSSSEEVFTVNVLRALREDIIPVMTVFGQVQSQRTLEIRAAVGGTIIELSPDFVEGGSVSEGQVLARIDPSESQAALDRAKADLLDAHAEVRDSARALAIGRDELLAAQDQASLRQTALERQQDLLLRRAGTQTAVEQAEIAVSSARAAVLAKRQAVAQAEARGDQAETRLARQNIAVSEAQRRLDNTQIRAGFDGTLTAVNVVEGRLVSINEQLAQLIDGNALEVTFRVSTAQFSRLIDQQGALRPARAEISLDVFGTNLEATGSLSRVWIRQLD